MQLPKGPRAGQVWMQHLVGLAVLLQEMEQVGTVLLYELLFTQFLQQCKIPMGVTD